MNDTTAAYLLVTMLFAALPVASFIAVSLIFLELRAIRKIHQASWNYESACELMRWRKKFYSPKTNKTDRLLAKSLIAHLQPCQSVKSVSKTMRTD